MMGDLSIGGFLRLQLLWLVATVSAAEVASNLPDSITLSYEILVPGSHSIKSLATISYDSSNRKNSISSWTPPSLDSLASTASDSISPQLVRILLPSGSSTLTSLGTFNKSFSQNVDLHLSPFGDGSVVSASVYASTPIDEELSSTHKSRDKGMNMVDTRKNAHADTKVKVKVIRPTSGAAPKLASKKPPVVGPDGREQPVPEEAEKSFFQKYWWVFAIVAVLAMAGGGDK